MKIMIDTKHDSQEDIRKVIELLSGILQPTQKVSNVFDTSTPANNLMGMFDVKDTDDVLPVKTKEPQIELY